MIYCLENLLFFDILLLYYYTNLNSLIICCIFSGDIYLSFGIPISSLASLFCECSFREEFLEIFVIVSVILLSNYYHHQMVTSNVIFGNSDDETSFPHKLLLTSRQVANLCKVFVNNSSTVITLSKTQLSKMIQSGGFLGRRLGPLLKAGLLLMKNVIKPLAKNVLIPLGLTAAASAADAGILKKSRRIWNNNTNNVK